MTAPIRRRPLFVSLVALTLLLGSLVAAWPGAVQAADTPRRGGVLLAVIGADPPSLDPHQESTFANIELVAPLYSTLLQLDPYNYPKIIGDLATEWKISPDGLTYTFKLHPDVKFHDGSPLTSADVKASYDKIIFPPQGVRSVRKNAYTEITQVDAPDPTTVVFKLKFPSGVAPGQPGLALERDLPQEVPRPGPQLLQDPRDRLGPVQVQGLHPRLHLRGRAQPRLLREGPPVPRRLQVLHQPGDLGAGRRHPVRARLHRVPEPAQRRGGGDQEAARRQDHGPGDPDDRRVGHRDQQHQEAVRRRPRPQGALPRHRSLHDGQGALSPHRAPLRGRPDAAGLGVGDAGGRAREDPGLRARHREEPGRGQEAPRGGRLSRTGSSSC